MSLWWHRDWQIEKEKLLFWPPFQIGKVAKEKKIHEISAEISKVVHLLPWTNNFVNVWISQSLAKVLNNSFVFKFTLIQIMVFVVVVTPDVS